jgi:hypothetical protein
MELSLNLDVHIRRSAHRLPRSCWHQPDEYRILAPAYEARRGTPARGRRDPQKLMTVGSQERLEFLG